MDSSKKNLILKAAGPALVMVLALFAVGAPWANVDPVPDFPREGPWSIFRDDMVFFHPGGEPDPVSVPPARAGCGVKLICDLEEGFVIRYEALKRARESIRIQTYIFTADEVGKKVADRLIRKRRHGVDVRLIVDTYTKFKTADRGMYADLELKGVTVMGYEPLYLFGVVDDRFLSVADVNKRFHEKYWVIDEELAFLGGTNIAEEYARWGDDPMNKWRDQDVLLTGPVVGDVTRAFEDNYDYFHKRRMDRFTVNRPSAWAALWWKISGTEPPPLGPDQTPQALVLGEMNDARAVARFIRSRPRHDEDYIYQAYLHLFENARKSILIENAYFVPNKPIIDSLRSALERGVEVTIITNSENTNDVSGMQPVSRYSYLPLMEAGAVVYEWQGDHPGKGSLHSKCAVIDGEVSVIGSFNLDPRGIYLNSENVVVIGSEKVARDLADYILTTDLSNSRKITKEQAEKWRDPESVSGKFKLLFGIAVEDWY